MTRRRTAAPACAALVAAILATAPAADAAWGPARDVTHAGEASAPAVSAHAEGTFAVGFIRTLGGGDHLVYRAELRRGTLTDGLRGRSVVLDRSSRNLAAITVAWPREDSVATAWLRRSERTRGPRAAFVKDERVHGPVNLMPEGTESASNPRFVQRPLARWMLLWDRSTSSAAAMPRLTTFGPVIALPGSGPSSGVTATEDLAGDVVATWRVGSGVVVATRGEAGFGPFRLLSGPGVARDTRIAATSLNSVLIAWVRNAGTGNVLEVATRPTGRDFGAPVAVSDPREGAFAPQLVVSEGSEVAAVWTGGTRARGWGSQRGPVRLRWLSPRGRPLDATITVTPPGVLVEPPTVVADGRGGVLVGWTTGPQAARRIIVRRVAGNGALGTPRTIAAGRWENPAPPVLAAANGRAVAVWNDDGALRYRLLR